MKSGNKAGSWLLVVLLTAAAINEIIPPQGTPLLDQFQQSASPDESNQATLDTILADAREMPIYLMRLVPMTSDLCSPP